MSAVNYHPVISMVFLKYMALLRNMFCTQTLEDPCKHGSLDALSLIYGPFILEGEGWKSNCKLICRKVLICE